MNFSSWVILLAAAMISASIAFSNHYGILALTEWVLRVIRLCPLPRECLTIGSHAEVICQGSSSNKGQHKLLAVKAMDQRLINCVLFTVSSRVNHCICRITNSRPAPTGQRRGAARSQVGGPNFHPSIGRNPTFGPTYYPECQTAAVWPRQDGSLCDQAA